MLLGLFLIGTGLVSAIGEPVKITADKVSGDAEKKLSFIEGHVQIVQGKTVITTEYVTVNLDLKTAVLERGVKLKTTDIAVDATHLEYNLKPKSGTFREQVVLKRIENKTVKDPFTLTADELYFETETKNFSATGHSSIQHKEFEGKANSIQYDDAAQRLIFKKDVVIRQGSTVIKTEAAVIDLRKKRLIFETTTDLSCREVHISAGSLEYNYEQKIGTFNQEVALTRSEVKNNKGKVTKEPFNLQAAILYFETETSDFSADQAKMDHQDFSGTADKIDYSDKLQVLTFRGNASLIRPHGDDQLKGDEIAINLEEQSFSVLHDGNIKLKVEEKK